MESDSYSFFILLTVVIGVCYCFYKVCEVFMYWLSLKYDKPRNKEKAETPKINIQVGDTKNDNENNSEIRTETNKE